MKNIAEFCKKIIKPEIIQVERISDSVTNRLDYLRLDKKERLVEFNKDLLDAFKNSIKYEDMSGYYGLEKTYRKLANYLRVNPGQLLLASGSDMAIKSVFEACLGKGDHIVLQDPSFAMVSVYAKMLGVDVSLVPIKEDWTVDFKHILAEVNKKTKMVVVENPNGSTGTKPDDRKLEDLASKLCKKDVLLLLDEAYFYVQNNVSQSQILIEKYRNVLITQSLSKAHGLAGLRAGYLIGDERIIEYISRVRSMYEVSSLSARAIEWILDHPELLEHYQRSIRESKEYLINELSKLNISVRDTHANFILIRCPNELRMVDITQLFKEQNILIRRPFDQPPLDGWLLVSIGRLSDSRQFLKSFTNIARLTGKVYV